MDVKQDEDNCILNRNSYAKYSNDNYTRDNQTDVDHDDKWVHKYHVENELKSILDVDSWENNSTHECKANVDKEKDQMNWKSQAYSDEEQWKQENIANVEKEEDDLYLKLDGDFNVNTWKNDYQAVIDQNELISTLDGNCDENRSTRENKVGVDQDEDEDKGIINRNTYVKCSDDDWTHDCPEDIDAGCGKDFDAEADVAADADADVAADTDADVAGDADTDVAADADADDDCEKDVDDYDSIRKCRADFDKEDDDYIFTRDARADGVADCERKVNEKVAKKESNLINVGNGRKSEAPAKEEERRKSGEQFETIRLVAEKELPGGSH